MTTVNLFILIHSILFKKHNFQCQDYEKRAIDQLITQKNTKYNLCFKEEEYNDLKEYITKDIKKQLSCSILNQICPLYDSIPLIPLIADLDEAKRLNSFLEEKMNVFLFNEDKTNSNDDCNDRNNKAYQTFLTKSLTDDINNDVFIHHPLAPLRSSILSLFPLSNSQLKDNNHQYTENQSTILNDSIDEITKFIKSIQYNEDIRKIDKKQNSKCDINMRINSSTNSLKPVQKFIGRRNNKENKLKNTIRVVNDTINKEEIKYAQQLMEETKKSIHDKKFKQTKVFLLRYNQKVKKEKKQGKIFKKIIKTFLNRKFKDYSTNKLFTRQELTSSSTIYLKFNSNKKMYNDNLSSNRLTKKSDRFIGNLSAISIRNNNSNTNNKYPNINAKQKPYCRISLNKKIANFPFSRNQPGNYYANMSGKKIGLSSTSYNIKNSMGIFRESNQSHNKSNNNNNNISVIFKPESYKNKIFKIINR